MSLPNTIEPQRVFKYFEEISAIPRGSENMEKIAQYCMDFAESHSLKAVRDSANNVIIYKSATKGYENAEPVILQGHLDIVCQKEEGCRIDFLKDGLNIYAEGDFVTAKGTTLGADNGIAVSMILAILESDSIPHPALEAVFTTDEEIGMIGAASLDMGLLKSKKMINLDAEEDDTLTVSCAGGLRFSAELPLCRKMVKGTEITVALKGLKGGHSGVEINKGRVNANMLAGRFLNRMNEKYDFHIVSINGGDKDNAIVNSCCIELCVVSPEDFKKEADNYLELIKAEISAREPDFSPIITVKGQKECNVISDDLKDKLIYALLCAPNGVMEMSAEIGGLVETSLNLGILKTKTDKAELHFALRSNKKSALEFLQDKLNTFFKTLGYNVETSGHYPPWEYKADSSLRELYKEIYTQQFGKEPKIEAIHAGLECGIFASKIEGIDCVSMGPQLYDVHTVNERLSISSTEQIYKLLLKILEKCR